MFDRKKPVSDEFKKGDKVKWKTSQGEITGEVVSITSPTDIKGHHRAHQKRILNI